MNILVLNWKDWKDPEAGGSELATYYLVQNLISKGHKVTYFCRTVNKNNQKNIIPIEDRNNKINIIQKGNRFSVYIWAIIYYLFKLRKKFDFIIDVHNAIPWFTPCYSRKKRILIVYHIVNKIWFREMPFPLSWIGYILETKIMPKVYRRTKIITISPSTKKEIIEMGFKKDNIIISYLGINKKLKKGTKSKRPQLVYIGRIKKYKNIDKFIDLCKDLNINGEIIGQGDYKKELKNYVEKNNLSNLIKFSGFVSEEKKIEAYQKAWAFIMPSMKEGWGITCIEANKCGTPVIAFNVEGIKDAIKNNKNGFLCKNYNEMLKKTQELINNKKMLEKLSKSSEESIHIWSSSPFGYAFTTRI